jgi:AcrR family transcriptional regulator
MTAEVLADFVNSDLAKKLSYHHGNLRGALLSAATQILEKDGVDGLSLRAMARATGVTQAAPYSHFRDKDELLAAIAEDGFQRLALQMLEDAAGRTTPRARIEKLILGYIRFALQNRALFRVMFGRELSNLKRFPTLAMTAGKSYALLSSALSQRNDNSDTALMSAGLWSLCHGLTTLLIDDRVNIAQLGCATLEDFVQKQVALFAPKL